MEDQLSRANRKGDLQAIKEIKEKLFFGLIFLFTTQLLAIHLAISD